MILINKNYDRRKRILLITLAAACLTLILHSIGLAFSLYWLVHWFDVLVHTIGGFVIGSLTFFFFGRWPWFALTGSLVAIICWELFEAFIIHIPTEGMTYIVDTTSDMIVGLVGVFVARLLVRRL